MPGARRDGQRHRPRLVRVNTGLEETVAGVVCVRWNPVRTPPDGSGSIPQPVSNFGDLLGPLIVDRIVSELGSRLHPDRNRRVLTVGSTMHFSRGGDVVWGTGINGKLLKQSIPVALDVRAVRGPYTRAVLTARGIRVPAVYGDPALLLSRLWPELALPGEPSRDLLVVPNLNEFDRFSSEGARSPVGDPWAIIGDIGASGFVTGTSLHALVIADALGVPNRPIRSEIEDPFKYLDYYAGTGRRGIRFAESVEEAVALGPVDAPEVDLDALFDAFPADVWLGTAPPAPHESARSRDTYPAMRAAFSVQLTSLTEGAESTATERYVAERARSLARRNLPVSGLTRDELAGLAAQGTLPEETPVPEGKVPLLSVVIPTHNVGPWIRETLTSVLSQDVDGMEVIVVDDHSNDATRAIVASFAERDRRLCLVDAVSRGGGHARNIGIDRARGRYLVFCDGDDIVPSGAYRALVGSLEKSGSDIAFGDYLKFSPVATWRPTANWPAYAESRQRFRAIEVPSIIYGRPCWNKAFRRSFWDEAGIRFPNVPRSNDIVPMMTAYLAASAIDMVDEVVYLYRERPGESSMTAKAESATALISYLKQEIACAEMIRDTSSAELGRAHASLFFDRDGWVHITKYLRSDTRDREREAEIARLIAQLSELTARNVARTRDMYKRLVFALLLEGEIDAAAGLANAVSGTSPTLARRIRGWTELVSAMTRSGRDIIGDEPRVAARIVEDIGAAIMRGDAELDDWIIELSRVLNTHDEQMLRVVPELAEFSAGSSSVLCTRFAATRALGATITTLTTGRALRFTMTGVDPSAAYDPVLYMEDDSSVVPMGRVRHETVDGTTTWSARIPAFSIRRHRAMRIALRDRTSGHVSSADLGARTPPYDRFDRFLLVVDQRGVRLMRRSSWVWRAAKQLSKRMRSAR
jgi:glycosyltransferase involved in cell wall biosynthesis